MAEPQQEIAELSSRIADLEARLAELSAELAELSTIMGPFLTRYHHLIWPYYEALAAAQREIADLKAAQGDRTASLAGEAISPLDRFFDDPSVQEQYERAWQGRKAIRPTGPLNMNPASPEVKQLYRQVVARLHPGLTSDPAERKRRRQLMGKVDEAYMRRDQISLEAMVDTYRPRSKQLAEAPADIVEYLRDRVVLLETAISATEGQKFDLRYGLVAKMKAYAEHLWAEEKRDLLAELNSELQRSLEAAQTELGSLRGQSQAGGDL